MDENASGTENGIDKRTRKAATESMTIVSLGSGEYKVFSGTRKSYVVNVITETCECPDEEYNHPADGCKHRQRVEMELGERPIPDLGGRSDVKLMTGRSREPEPTVATDGGAVVDDTPQGSSDETGRPEDCDCSPAFDDDELGCWPCYRDGHETANPTVEVDENDGTPARSEPADFGGGESTGVIDL